MWQTHRFVMSDEFAVPATAMQTEIELQAFEQYNPPSLADGAFDEHDVTMTGLIVGDFVRVSFSNELQGISLTAWAKATHTARVRFHNKTGGTVDLSTGTLRLEASAHNTRTAIRGELNDLWSSIVMADGITTSFRFNVAAPYAWNTGKIIGLKLRHAQSTSNTSKQVRLRVRVLAAAPGAPTSTLGVDENYDIAVNDNAGRHTVSDISFASPLAFTKGDYVAFRVERIGGDVNDTASGNLHVIWAAPIYQAIGPTSVGSGSHAVPPTGV
jgi:hypothetical protein